MSFFITLTSNRDASLMHGHICVGSFEGATFHEQFGPTRSYKM